MPHPSGPAQRPPPPLVLWVIWFAMLVSVTAIQFVLGHGWPQGVNASTHVLSPGLVVGGSEVFAATACRWLVLPRAKGTRQLMVVMIIGLALSEGASFMALFLIPADQPQTKAAMFLLSLLSMLQFAPVYAQGGATKTPLGDRNDP